MKARTGSLERLAAVLGLALVSPVLAVASLCIRAASPGPILFRAQRAGRGGLPITVLKFRTMHCSVADGGPITARRDPRIFWVGSLLRRFKLDELPQLVNVARGDMRFVGPRPEDIDIVREHYDDMMLATLVVPPGITSPGSLAYFAGEDTLPSDPAGAVEIYLSELLPEKIAIDLAYLSRRTFGYDVQVVVRTLLAACGVSGAFAGRQAWELAEARKILADRRDPEPQERP